MSGDVGGATVTLVEAITLLLGLLAIDLGIKAALWRLKKGQFRVDRNDSHAFRFETDCGRFTIDRRRLVFRADRKGRSYQIPLDRIDRLDFAYHEKWAAWQELFTGIDLWDLAGAYRDTTEWYEISIVVGSEKTPVFIVGQYHPRELFSRWYFELQARLLARVGLFVNFEEKAMDVLDRLQEAFRVSGRQLALGPTGRQHPQKRGEMPRSQASSESGTG
jgi:hypothetical protein